MANILFCGDNHGRFDHIIDAVERERPDAVVLLGDVQAQRPLEVELASVVGKTVVRFIYGNHDTDSDFDFRNLFDSALAGANLDGRVEEIAGIRIAGLGGIFRGKVWMPPDKPKVDSYAGWRRANKPRHGTIDRTYETQVRTHRSTIFWDVYERLWDQKADVLVTHEAPSVHPHGMTAIDDLARAMGVKKTFHGHHHDSLDYSTRWPDLGFEAYGVGFCGISDLEGRVVRTGEFDHERSSRLP